MSHPTVELQSVNKHYGEVHALQNMNLVLQPGEVLGMFGHNGAGKSTIMKLILGLVEPSSGTVKALGHTPTSMGSQEYRRQFGFLPENVSFYDHLSGNEVLSFFASLKGYGRSEVGRLLKEVGLEKAARRAVKTYSKGMRQRLGLAQAMLGEPRLLLFDEPTVGLDPIATEDFYLMVDRLKSQGCSVILCSHVLSGVESHIDRAVIISSGRQVAGGTLGELRDAASLPVEITVKGVGRAMLEPYLAGFLDTIERPGGELRLTFPQGEKVRVLKTVMAMPGMSDIAIHQPSLSDIYSYYNMGRFSRADEGAAHA